MKLCSMTVLPKNAKRALILNHQRERLFRISDAIGADGTGRISRLCAMRRQVEQKIGSELAYAIEDFRRQV